MPPRPIIVGLGEVLWDLFPTGPKFGGAPANFACAVAELGGDAVDVHILSAVGDDGLGRQAIELLNVHGVSTALVSIVDWPTGQVIVELDAAGRPSFEIAADVAWDYVPSSGEAQQLAARTEAVCFGTLAQRSPVSRETVRSFLRATPPSCLRILDINLRPPFWDHDIVLESLALANVLKLNDTELPVLADALSWKGGEHELLERLIERFGLRLVALTRGADGAILHSATGQLSELPGQKVTVADTVGAGDAYTAALAIGLLSDLPLATTGAWAIRVAAFVCTQPGATPHFPDELRQPLAARKEPT